ncbi:MAG: thioredoxin [Thaumarchaeota archaeon]|nr:thioredoxin [Nitrososphaerota archaeon]
MPDNAKVVSVTDTNFEEEVLKSEGAVFVDFYADWCGPCRAVSPIVEELSEDYDGRMKFVKVNVDNAPDVAAKYGVMSIPTLIIFNKGEREEVFVGAGPKSQYKGMIDKVISK